VHRPGALDIIAGQRCGAEPVRELSLKDHPILPPEAECGGIARHAEYAGRTGKMRTADQAQSYFIIQILPSYS